MIENTVTIDDIQSQVPVSARTIRNWIAYGLLPRPVLVSEGYKCGVRGLYPNSAIGTAKMLHATRCLPLEERRHILARKSRYSYRVEDDGTVILTIKAKRVGGT